MTDHFNTQMAEFQKSLQGAIPAASPTSNIAGQFNAFRAFVLSALAGLQQQVELLAKQTDQLEMRSRRKMLLVHGVPEGNNDNLLTTVTSSLSNHLKLPDLQEDCISRCQRLGQPKGDKPRAILLKFQDMPTKNQVWYAKTSLKNTGITLSEFLTKDRHDAFMAARQRFGVSKCWTREGLILIVGEDGKRHRVTSKAEVNAIPQAYSDVQVPTTAEPSAGVSNSKTTSAAPKVVKPAVKTPLRQKRLARR
ncbi:jg7359 [Pararge aegeria aegeria]|uniref:Jg7359 protein n=1 Tax=Pararge aegeria aegeria TaxID=348720 RepID=A0A8S4R2G0_9NEOP|nr:jg7359 [Pararge aegeria aegeria]